MEKTFAFYQQQAAGLDFETRALIGGRFVNAISAEEFDTINPATGRRLAGIARCGALEVDDAVSAARRVFERGDWSRATPKHRKKVLLRFADLVEAKLETLAIMESLDSGKPIRDALSADLPDMIESLRWHAEAADKLYDQVAPTAPDIVAMIVREPVGVVGAVLPWNFPIYLAGWKIGPALASGNSIVIKPAEQTTLTALVLGRLALEAGVPDGVLNIVPGHGETVGQAIGRHGDIDCVSFTGSGEVGRLFLKYSAESNMKRVVLECGGKSPALVLADAYDLAGVAQQVALGALFCQGENCSAGSRLIVHRSRKDELLEQVKRAFDEWCVGDPLDPATRIGAMIEPQHMRRVLGYIAGGKEQGAQLVYGGQQVRQDSGGSFVEPTIFDRVQPSMTIAREEIFGPVLSVLTFDSLAEGVAIANDTSYGLASSVYTSSLDAAHSVAKQIRAGTVSVNCFSEGDTGVPFGGYKESGFGGREKSLLAHDQYMETKTIWMQLGRGGA
ncbi:MULTISPECIES: aldehyde dehydrogenase [unclassified Duganella]|uniref:aldehyde dehydrogenase n=1 Tax=unclassified Duganella TaxID=2636909 RepID=UPI00089004B6|nr:MULTISPECIES: aldehyde dehydrogenase [unclassified Duganella]SDF52356.1 gamma-glutamyl-gamma-aminobutyraldehyde dehydrogenase [Duganella sp. OV458]SDI74864.1 gamma-glutamyl-gamma-aminobutyraldehyde dehydrogenase [Duganella sp. OV510]